MKLLSEKLHDNTTASVKQGASLDMSLQILDLNELEGDYFFFLFFFLIL